MKGMIRTTRFGTALLAGVLVAGGVARGGSSVWTAIGPGGAGADVRALAIDPGSPTTVYAGTAGGVYKTTNGGATWTTVNQGVTNLSVLSLAIVPGFSSTLYAGTENGIFKTDSGANWTLLPTLVGGSLLNLGASAFAIDPTRPATLYAGTDVLVLKSINGGESWVAASFGLPPSFGKVFALAIDPRDVSNLYAGTLSVGAFQKDRAELFLSRDA